jgi:hypothetical protein
MDRNSGPLCRSTAKLLAAPRLLRFFIATWRPAPTRSRCAADELYPNQFKTVRLAPGSITFVQIQEQPLWGQSDLDQGATFVVTIIDPAIGTAENEALFGSVRVFSAESWKAASLRDSTIRLVRYSMKLLTGGYRDLLRGRPPAH